MFSKYPVSCLLHAKQPDIDNQIQEVVLDCQTLNIILSPSIPISYFFLSKGSNPTHMIGNHVLKGRSGMMLTMWWISEGKERVLDLITLYTVFTMGKRDEHIIPASRKQRRLVLFHFYFPQQVWVLHSQIYLELCSVVTGGGASQ